MAGLLLIGVVVLVIAIVLSVRAMVFMATTFGQFGKECKALWYSLGVCVGLLLVGGLLLYLQQVSLGMVLEVVAPLQLLLVCKVVATQQSQTVTRQEYSVVSDILKKNWWSPSDTGAMAA